MSVRSSVDTETGGAVVLDDAGHAPRRRVPWSARREDRPWPPATHRLLLATGLLLALGTFWTVLSMPDLPYHPARDLELRATYDTYVQTGVPLVKENGTGSWYGQLPGEGLTKAAGDDDPGSYLVASWMSHLTGSDSPYPGLRWVMALLCALPMLVLPVTVARIYGRARAGMAMLGLPVLTWLANGTLLVGTEYGLSDKVATTAVYALYGLPASLIFLSLVLVAYAVTRRPGVRAAVAWTIALVLLATFGNLLRSLSGAGIALAAGVVWWVAWRGRLRWAVAAAAAAVSVVAAFWLPGVVMDRIDAQRDPVVSAETSKLLDAHGTWHPLYLGLSYPQPITGEPSKFGIEWSDEFGWMKAREVDPDVVVSSAEYDLIIKDLFLDEVRSAPLATVALYVAKTVYTAKHFAALLAVILLAMVMVWRRPGPHRAVLRQVSAASVPILLLGLVPPVLVMPMIYYYTELVAALALLTALALGGIVWALTTLPSAVRADERARAREHASAGTAEPTARLSVVVPTSDDTTDVRRSLDALGDRLGDRLGADDEVVVVRHGAPDPAPPTWDHPARLVVLDSEPGLGNALRTGVLASRGSRVLVGAQRPLDPRDLDAFAALDDAVVLAVGSQPHPAPRRARVWPWLRRALLHTSVEDTEGTYWVDGRWVRSFAAVSREDGPAWTTELVLAAQQQGVEVWEVPVTARRATAARGGRRSWRDRVVAVKDVVGLAARRDDYLVLPGRHPIP
jgi:hypothetical protein